MENAVFDVLIIGAGLVGSSLALALRETGLRVAVVEARPPLELPDPAGEADWDSRIYAISPGSAEFLARLGIWQSLEARRTQRVEAMVVYGDDRRARLDFDAYDAGLGQLAYIVESRLLQNALWAQLVQTPAVHVFCPARCDDLSWQAEQASLRLDDGNTLEARLVVAADGAHSWVRQAAGIGARDKDYRQLGVVANFATALPHRGTAYQWFQREGVLAYLPLPGNRVSMVWSLREDLANELLALPPEALAREVAEAGGACLGELQVLTPPAAFPLHLIRPETVTQARLALIGDAAHQVHPLAGQGVNLGFGDAQALAGVLAERGMRDCGDAYLLRRYARERREAVWAMQQVTDGLQRLFNRSPSFMAPIRNGGLAATNRSAWLKRQLVKHALGSI